MTRQEANIILAKEILKACENPRYKDYRFWQLLVQAGVITYIKGGNVQVVQDDFNEESITTLIKMLKKESNL